MLLLIVGCTANTNSQSQGGSTSGANLSSGDLDSMIQELDNMVFEDLGGLSE